MIGWFHIQNLLEYLLRKCLSNYWWFDRLVDFFSHRIFNGRPFKSVATYCRVYLFAKVIMVVNYLFFQSWVIKFHIKSKWHICLLTFYAFVFFFFSFFFQLLVSCLYLFQIFLWLCKFCISGEVVTVCAKVLFVKYQNVLIPRLDPVCSYFV